MPATRRLLSRSCRYPVKHGFTDQHPDQKGEHHQSIMLPPVKVPRKQKLRKNQREKKRQKAQPAHIRIRTHGVDRQTYENTNAFSGSQHTYHVSYWTVVKGLNFPGYMLLVRVPGAVTGRSCGAAGTPTGWKAGLGVLSTSLRGRGHSIKEPRLTNLKTWIELSK